MRRSCSADGQQKIASSSIAVDFFFSVAVLFDIGRGKWYDEVRLAVYVLGLCSQHSVVRNATNENGRNSNFTLISQTSRFWPHAYNNNA